MTEVKLRDLDPMKEIYLFECTNKGCACLKTGVGLFYITASVKEAEEHSRENDSPMWISKRTVGAFLELLGKKAMLELGAQKRN